MKPGCRIQSRFFDTGEVWVCDFLYVVFAPRVIVLTLDGLELVLSVVGGCVLDLC